MASFIPGSSIVSTSITTTSIDTTDTLLKDNDGLLIVDIDDNRILLGGGIVADDPVIATLLTPSARIVATYMPESTPIAGVEVIPSGTTHTIITGAQEPTAVTWG